MTGKLYDRIVCDPWAKFSPVESTYPKGAEKLPIVLVFLRKPKAGKDADNKFIKDEYLLKTMHLLA